MDVSILNVVYEGIKQLDEVGLVDKKQFAELLTSVQEMDNIVSSKKSLEETTQTDWQRLSSMTDDEIDTSDIAELDDEFFECAQLRQPENSRD